MFFVIEMIIIFMKIILGSHVLKQLRTIPSLRRVQLQGFSGGENMMFFNLFLIFLEIIESFSYKKLSDNHFSHMNIDENSTPDRFEPLPMLLDHLNDEL